MKNLFFIIMVMFAITPIYSQIGVPSDVETTDIEGEKLVAGEGEKKVITSAYGETPEKALENALRNAVEEAVGALVSSETIIENDDIVKDEVLSYSKGFIKTYKKLSEEKDDGDYKVSVVAIITQKQLIEKLEATGVKVEYQTSGMFAQLQAWDKMKREEFEMAKRILTVDMDKKFPVAYDFQVSVGAPERSGDFYYVGTKILAKPNGNFDAIIQNTKAVLNEIAYEAREYSYLWDLGHKTGANSTAKMNYAAWVNVQLEITKKRNGKEKVKKQYQMLDCNFPEYEPRLREGDYDMLSRGRTAKRLEFLGALDYEPLAMLAKRKFEKELTQEDKNRLNDRSLYLDRVNIVYDVFDKNYTPYLFIIREPKKITVYKFLNPATTEIAGRYFMFLLEALHFKTVVSMNGSDDLEVINPAYHQVMYAFDSGLRTTSQDIKNLYRGFVLDALPRIAEYEIQHKFEAADFSKITNIGVEPSYEGYQFYETNPE
ncbi:MAG: hypothetical protein K9H15_13435 [Bacteroidales bacterium]|nr:hypothetical protein [Bacteroidales bacterium]